MPTSRISWLCALGLLSFAAPAARAATFDVIHISHLAVTTSGAIVGFTLAGTDIALVVNKGPADIGATEFFGTQCTTTSSNPTVGGIVFINNPGPAITPILPGQALGSVSAFNGVLTSQLAPGETLHNTAPLQVIALEVGFPAGFQGQATLDVTMVMGDHVAHFPIALTFTTGPAFGLQFLDAGRVSGVPVATPTEATTWGRVKAQYH